MRWSAGCSSKPPTASMRAYQPKPGQKCARAGKPWRRKGFLAASRWQRDYYYHPGKQQGHYPADAALGLEVGYTPALAKLICLEGADEPTYLKAERHLEKTGGIAVSARQIQRVVQRVGGGAQAWQERPAQPGPCDAPILYVSADGTGVPMVPEELEGAARQAGRRHGQDPPSLSGLRVHPAPHR